MFVLLAAAGLGVTSLLGAELGGERGRPGEAQGRDTLNFSESAERERREGVPAVPTPARPALRRSAAPRGHTRPLLPAVEPDANAVALAPEPSPALAFTAASGGAPSPTPSAGFEALADDDTAFNPDTHGAVGPDHLMVTLASQVRIQDRTGNALQTLSLNAFWGTIGNSNVYDPRVLYDRAAQRWITTALCNPASDNPSILIGVSQTSDPTGTWFRRAVRTDLTAGVFPDSPNVGLTRDWITVSANMFSKTNFEYFSCDIWAFNKANLYSGGAGQFTFFRYFDAWLGEASVLVPVVNYDNGATNILVSNFEGDFETPSGTFGYLRFFSITGPVGGESFNDFGGPGGTNGVYVGLATPWASYPPGFQNFAPQKGTANKVYIGDARIQNVIYRDGFLWIAQHIFLPSSAPNRVGLQWMSTTPGGGIDQLGLLNDQTAVNSYAYPSLAVNVDGDMLIGFTSFSANQYPTAAYALHSYEEINSLRLPGVSKAGQTNFFIDDRGINHWGDWSATVVDPLNDTDFWTIQEYAAAHVNGESRWGTWWGRVSPQVNLSVAQTDAPDPLVAGSTVTYSVSITNLLVTIATGTRIVDTLPLGSVFVSATPTQGVCGHTNGVVTCNFGDLAGDSIYAATIVARLNQGGTATNSVTASSFGPDINPSDNTIRVLTTVSNAADLTVLMTASANPVTVSNTLTYLVTATNRGPSLATAVQLSDTLPPGVTFLSATPGQGSCSQNAGVVNCNLGTITGGNAITVSVQVRPNAAGQLTNRASVVASVFDPVAGNNSTTNITRANAAPTMQAISNRTIAEDAVLSPIDFTVGDLETPAASLILSGSSSDQAIVPNANIVFGGSGSLRNIRVTPLPNANGNVSITRTLTDAEGGSVSSAFVLTVTPVSDLPSIGAIANQVTPEDQALAAILFAVDDADSGAAGLTVAGASSNPTLIPNANLSFGGGGGFRSLTVRPATNQFGTATITVSVSDGSATTNTSFLVTVNSVNDLPTVTDLPDRVVNEDAAIGVIAFTVNDIETTVGALTASGSSSNPSLLPGTSFTFGGSGANRTVNIIPATNQFGSATVTLSITDTNGGVGTDTFVLTVNPVNDPPTLGAPATLTINENAGQQRVALTNITAGGVNEGQTVTFSATSSNPLLLPNPTVSYTSPATTGDLVFTTVANSTGTATVTLTANDGGASNNITTRQIVVTVSVVNDAPTISDVPNQTINEDSATATLPFTLADSDSPTSSFSVSGASSDAVLVPPANIVFGGTGASRTVRVTPAADQSGSATISILATDGSATNTETFVLTVLQVNDLPTLSLIADRTINEDAATNISFTISDSDTPLANLTLSATSSNPALVPSIAFGGTGSARTVNIVPAAHQSGTALITVRVADEQGTNATSFQLTILPMNDPPTLDPIASRSVLEDAPGPINIPLAGIGSGAPNEVQSLTVTAVSSHPLIIPNPAVTYLSPNVSGSLAFTPTRDSNGTVTITVLVSDGAATSTRSFDVTIQPVNDPPVLGTIPNQTIDEDATVQLSFYVSDLETPSSQLFFQADSSNTELLDSTGIAVGGSGTNRTLIITPLPDASGSSTVIELSVTDGGSASASISFEITVRPINDLPRISGLSNTTIPVNSGPTQLNFSVNDPETLPSAVTVTATSSNQGLVPNANLQLGGTGAARTLTVTPLAGVSGTTTLQLVARDANGGTGTNSIVLTVAPPNDPPTLDPLVPITMVEDAAPRSIALSGITAGPPGESQSVSVSATSSNPDILPNPQVSYLSPATTGSLILTPRPNSNGVVTVTVTVNDGQPHGNLFSRTFTVTITPVNDAPFVLPVDSQATPEDVPVLVNVTLIDTDTAPSSLTLTASSSNPALIPTGGIAVAGTGSNRTVTLTPAQNQSGFAYISLVAGDGSGSTTTHVFECIVQPVNDLPTIADIANTSVNEDAQISVPFTIGDVETASAQLALTAASSDPVLLPLSRITFGGSGANRTVAIAPTTNRSGSVTVTITATDADGGSRNDSFVLSVNAVNDLPTLTGLPNLSVSRSGATGPLPVTVGDVETPAAGLTLTANSSNSALVPNGNVVLAGSGFARTVTVTPVANQTGTATITLTLADGSGGSTNTSFTVTVQPMNNPPTLNALSNLTLSEDPGTQIVSLSGISAGGADVQPIAVQATSSNPALIPTPSVVYGTPNPTGSLSFTPVANASGTAVITVSVTDGQPQDGSFSRSFTVTINPVNDLPAISNIPDQTTPEDTPLTVPFTISDPENPAFRLTLTATSGTTTLVANTNIFFGNSGTNRTIRLVPSPDQTGTSTITVRVTDGVVTNTDTFVLTVTSVNDAPTLNPIPNFSANAANGNPSHVINLSGISSGAASESQTLTVTATSSAPGTIPNPTVTYTSPSATGTLAIRPGNNNTGAATITVTVSDGTASIVRTFFAGIKATGNVLPTVSIVPTINLNEDASTNISFQVRDAETAVGSLTLRVFSSNEQLFPDASLILGGGTGTTRTLALTPLPNRSGTASITLGVVDGGFGASNMTFTVNVGVVNDPPSLTGIPNQSVNDGTPTQPLAFTVNDLETAPGNLTVTATSANQTLVPNANLFLGGAGSDRVLVVTPAPNQVGTANITVTVSDGPASTNVQFTLTVNDFNEPPTVSDIPDQTVAVNTPTSAIAFTIGDSETPPGNLTLSGSSSNTDLVPDAAIVFGGSSSSRTVTVTPAAGAAGTATITVRVSDGINQVSDTFVLAVTTTGTGNNARPTIDPITDLVLSQSGAARTVSLTGIGSGAANEVQPLIVAASSSDPAVVPHPALAYSSPAATGTLTLRATPLATGTATITVTVSDAQAQNGTLTRTFLASINAAPVLTGLTNLFLNEDTSNPALAFTVTDADDAPANLTVSATSSNPALLPATGLSLGGSGNNRTLIVTPLPSLSGLSTVTVTASDTGGNVTVSELLVTVFPVNDAPTLAPLADLTLPLSAGAQTVNLLGIGSGAANESQSLAVTATSSAPEFLPDPLISYASPAATGSLALSLQPGVAGSAVITVVVWDNGGIANGGLDNFSRTFTVMRSGLPTLLIVRTGANSAAVSWPTGAGPNWTLQSSINLGNPAGWAQVSGTPAVVNSRYTVNVPLSGQTVFFRLRQ